MTTSALLNALRAFNVMSNGSPMGVAMRLSMLSFFFLKTDFRQGITINNEMFYCRQIIRWERSARMGAVEKDDINFGGLFAKEVNIYGFVLKEPNHFVNVFGQG